MGTLLQESRRREDVGHTLSPSALGIPKSLERPEDQETQEEEADLDILHSILNHFACVWCRKFSFLVLGLFYLPF